MDINEERSAHLGSYLGNNGKKGGWPGAGRPKSDVREACKQAFEKRIPILCKIADDETKRAKERIDAIAELRKTGLGDRVEVVLDDNEVLARIARVTAKFLPEDQLGKWITECRKAIKDS